MTDTSSDGRDPAGRGELAVRSRPLFLEEGLHALSLAEPGNRPIQVAAPPTTSLYPVEIVGAAGAAGWLPARGDILLVRARAGGGLLLLTGLGADALPDTAIDIRRLDGAGSGGPAIEAAGIPVRLELLLHIERQGDRRFTGPGWAGNPGSRLQIEGFALNPGEFLQADEIECRGYGPDGIATSWTSGGALCGTRGHALPLTGFAIRVPAAKSKDYDVLYEGAFRDGRVIGPRRNGEPCHAPRLDQPLVAMNVRIVKHPFAA